VCRQELALPAAQPPWRRGAWYRVVALTPREAILNVKRKYIRSDRVVLPLSAP